MRKRLSLDVSPEEKNMIELAAKASKEPSITSLVKRSVSLYSFLLDIQNRGGKVTVSIDGKEEIIRFL